MNTNPTSRFGLVLVLLGMLLAPAAQAQTKTQPAPAAGGYWNTETNLTTRDHTIVRFYNAAHELVYEERLDNICLEQGQNTACSRRTTRLLSQALQQVLTTPEAARTPGLLAQHLGTDRRLQRMYAVR
jgi:hypothetical protein